MIPTLYVICGVPGSGKTTFLKNNTKKTEVIVSRDDVRYSLLKDGEEYFSHEKEVFNIFTDIIIKNLLEKKDVYADATHLNKGSRNKLLKAIRKKAPDLNFVTEAICFVVPIDICLNRNAERIGTKAFVPQKEIRKMYRNYFFPRKNEENFWHCWLVGPDSSVSKYF